MHLSRQQQTNWLQTDLQWESLNTITILCLLKNCIVCMCVCGYKDRTMYNDIEANENNHYSPPKKTPNTPTHFFYR